MTGFWARWAVFSAAPHRLFFWSGALYAAVAVGLWSVQQASLYSPLWPPFAWRLPYAQAHAFMMIYGLFGFYFFGFLLTTFPRWLDSDPVPRPAYLTAWALLVLGVLAFWGGLFGGPGPAVAGIALMAAAYAVATGACLAILARTWPKGREQQAAMCLGLALAICGMAAAGWFFAGGPYAAYLFAREVGLYGFVLVVVFAVAYRMVPFFTSTAVPGYQLRRTPGLVYAFTAGLLLRAVLGWLELPAWSWTADGALLALLLWEVTRWRFWRATRPPLLLILYVAMAWWVLALALGAGESFYLWASGAAAAPFRNAALHALAVGALGSLLVGMSTRVTLGHSGRGLVTGRTIHGLFWGFQLVPLARVAPAVAGHWWPAVSVQGFWAGWLWVLVFGAWLFTVGAVLLRPRVDGRPG